MGVKRWVAAGAAGAASAWYVVRAPRKRAYPPGPDAVRPEGAREQAKQLISRTGLTRRDLAIDFAPATATSVEPLLHGRRYFPRMLDDINATTDHVHLLIYGYKPGDI